MWASLGGHLLPPTRGAAGAGSQGDTAGATAGVMALPGSVDKAHPTHSRVGGNTLAPHYKMWELH